MALKKERTQGNKIRKRRKRWSLLVRDGDDGAMRERAQYSMFIRKKQKINSRRTWHHGMFGECKACTLPQLN